MKARIIAVALIVTGFLLDSDVVGLLASADKSSSIAQAILALQGLFLAGGLLLLLLPAVLPASKLLQNLAAAGALTMCALTLVGTAVLYIAPPTDYRVFTTPIFNCAPTDAFCNTTAAAGLNDVIRYGKGAAFADMDGDGWVDLFAADAEPRDNDDWGVSSFYLNNGDGSFRPVDIGVSEDDLLSSWAGSFADYDNDGDQDLVLTGGGYAGVGRLALYENRMAAEGKFVSASKAAGIGELNEGLYRWWGVAWADYDNDGFLDFAVSRVYGKVLLFHNNGDRTFTDVTEKYGIETRKARTRDGKNIVWIDYDSDGDLDLYYAGMHAHMFYRNEGGEAFTDVTDEVFAGLLPENWLWPKDIPAVFSAAAVDIDQDGLEDLYLGRQAEQDIVLFNRGGTFEAKGQAVGLDANLIPKNNESKAFENTMGLGVGDIFNDGWPDIIIGSGDPVRADEDVIYCNKGGTFERCTEVLRANADGPYRTRTHGVAFGDVNQDGLSDVFQSLGGHAPWDQKTDIDSREYGALFVAQPQQDHNTAVLVLEGTNVNRDAIGARLKVTADEVHYYTVHSTQAFQSQNDRAQIVALGRSDKAAVEVTWPDGDVSIINVVAGERLLVRQGEKRVLN